MNEKIKKWWPIFCSSMTCKNNRERDFFVVLIVIFMAAFFLGGQRYFQPKKITPVMKNTPVQTPLTEEQIVTEIQAVQKTVDTTDWKIYQNQIYGFEIKYPQDWVAPKSQPISSNSRWAQRFEFQMNDDGQNPYLGFDVAVYEVAKIKELSNTAEFPALKSLDLKNSLDCQNIEGHVIDTGDYPVAEIYIPPTDNCYQPTLFFTFIRDQYIYNLVPKLKSGSLVDTDPRFTVERDFPEFLAAISTAQLIDIQKPKPQPVKPKITAPLPASYRVVNGRLVCAKSNDKPSKSNQNKKKHLDMECCLDPDEYPNPHCYYDPKKYGKYF